MTATSSFAFSTMEVPSMDDTMEMASPYQGHADDFEIDIDVMEDQVSNPDKDMTAEDEYMDNSHGDNHGQDGFPDEDMIDDVAEPSMIDADEYPGTNQNIDMQYEEGKADEERKTYEAEMLEDEYDEDIDVPVPEHEHEVPPSLEPADSEENPRASPTDKELHEDHTKSPSEPQDVARIDETQLKLQTDSGQTANNLDSDQPVAETAHVESLYHEEATGNTNEAEQTEKAEPKAMHNNSQQETSGDLQHSENEDGDSDQAQSFNDDAKELKVEPQDEQQVPESNDQAPEQERGSTESPSLYPVKVYYQDNEISLFPPREGDSSETFFLEDEGLAYDSFGKLFVACREVLQNHINENEVLIVDIETLNIQLTEDSPEMHKVTLKQIVDVYLQLCHNDGTQEPGALYLTLSTKLTVAAELSDLLLAASEGKGLSEIQSWEVYPEEGASAEYEETAQEPYPEELQVSLDKEGNEGALDESTSHGPDAPNPQQDAPKPQESQNVENTELEEVAINAAQSEARPGSSHTASHNSEEQNTESTGTLEPLPSADATEERPEPEEAIEDFHDSESNEDEYHDGDEPDDGAYPEEGPFVHAAGSIGNLDEPERDDTGNLTEEHPEEYHDLKSGYHEKPPSGEDVKNDDSQNQEGLPLDDAKNQDSPKETEATPDESHQTQHVVDDSLGATDELLKSPGSDSKVIDEQAKADDAIEPGELDEAAENALAVPAENDEGADLPFEDDEVYLDLGIADDLGDFDEDQDVATTSHISGKRIREPDDELDLPESTSSEVKRSRSS
ncbi:hypothetical protein BDW62DRAFT_193725 [Aspergillus aurantiobrunneus]